MSQTLEPVEASLTRALVGWSVLSVVAGGAAALAGRRSNDPDVVAFGRQTAVWGAVDGVIAGVGMLSRRRRGSLNATQREQKVRALRTLLIVNAIADVGYVAGGAAVVARSRGERSLARMRAGDGIAIIVQGAFLLVLDTSQALRLRSSSPGA